MWTFIAGMIAISVASLLAEKYPETNFFRFMWRYRDWVLTLVSLSFYAYFAIHYGAQPFLNVFILILMIGIFYCIKD